MAAPVEFIIGDNLVNFCADALLLNKRDAYAQAEVFVCQTTNLRTVGIVYGMRSTGKTIILRQLAGRGGYVSKSAYVSINYGRCAVEDIYAQIKILYDKGIRYFYIDEVTWADGFTDRAMEFADVWAAFRDVRIVLSGTDSLSFTFAMQESLYGRYALFTTTPMGYSEYKRTTGGDVLSFARSGGVYWPRSNVFDYMETSVVRNIFNSVAGIQRQVLIGEALRFVTLQEMYAICHGICMSITEQFICQQPTA
jgi:predicted AAA+ superfamily ATPase